MMLTDVRVLPLTACLIAAAFAAACDPQVDPEYQGEALARVSGTVEGSAPQGHGELQIAALWFTSTAESECSGPQTACSLGAGGPFDVYECVQACGEPDTCDDVPLLDAWVACVEACGGEASAEYDIAWGLCADVAIASTVPVVGQFPAMFNLDLFAPPPAAALMQSPDGGPAVGLAWILVVDEHAPSSFSFFDDEDGEPDLSWILGVAEANMLMYAAAPVPADSPWGQLLGGAYEPGYHVIAASTPNCWEEPAYPDGGCMLGEECPEPTGTETHCDGASTLEPSAGDLETAITVKLGALAELSFPMPGVG